MWLLPAVWHREDEVASSGTSPQQQQQQEGDAVKSGGRGGSVHVRGREPVSHRSSSSAKKPPSRPAVVCQSAPRKPTRPPPRRVQQCYLTSYSCTVLWSTNDHVKAGDVPHRRVFMSCGFVMRGKPALQQQPRVGWLYGWKIQACPL